MLRRCALFSLILAASATAAEPAKIDYSRDVRPILSEHCFKCHGPGTQKAGVRLDNQQAAMKKESLVPGKPEKSELFARVVAEADEERMPPPEAGKKLTAKQIATLKSWIEQGGEYAPHWAFVAMCAEGFPVATVPL